MSIQLFPHQEKSVNDIIDKFKTYQRLLFQLSTGGGKTYCFSFLTKHWIENNPTQKVLILCHRTELVEQTFKSLNQIGVTCEIITAGKKYLTHSCNAYICMVQTLSNRLEKNPDFLRSVGLVIADECHVQIFNKIFPYFPTSKILGCTATPVLLKRVTFYKCQHCKAQYDELTTCCGDEVMEWSRPVTMSETYEEIVVGASIKELIEMGNLVQEITFVKDYANTSSLKIDNKTGDYSTDSLNNSYNEESALFNVVLNYEEICKGKKTMVFNSTTKSNLLVYNRFKEAGYNVRIFDTVNGKDSGGRKGLVKWFKETPDAILCNVGVFTTGFDVTDVEAIMLNTSTQSLSLFLQMVGRGGRSTKVIYKDHFIVIDGGNNIERHNEWSDASRDWRRIFFEGLSKEREKSKKVALDDVQACEGCGYLMPKAVDICPECGEQIKHKPPKEKAESDLVTTPIRKIPPPNAEKIYMYVKSKDGDMNMAWRILINQIHDMFRYYRVQNEAYISAKETGELVKKIGKMVRDCYFTLYSKHDLPKGTNRTIKYLVNKTITKLDEYYGTQNNDVALREHVLEG